MTKTEREYTPKEVAEICRVREFTVWDWIRKGKLEARSQLGRYRVSENSLQNFLQGQNKGER